MYKPLPSRAYDRAPLTEAVIEIRVAGDLSPKLQEKLAQRLKKSYPHSQVLNEIEVKVDTTGGGVDVRQQSKGQTLRLSTDEAIDIALIRPQSLVTARTPPYLGWEYLRDRARENWSAWKAVAPAYDVERVGVRFINRIDLPGGAIRLEDWLAFHPQASVELPAKIMSYVVQVTLQTHMPLWTATLTSTGIQPPPVPDRNSMLLDIDVFRTGLLPKREEDLWPVIDEARIIKNDLFERCITEKTRELFRA